jgi:hypothetical protein
MEAQSGPAKPAPKPEVTPEPEPEPAPKPGSQHEGSGKLEQIKIVGGLAALVSGLLALVLVLGFGLIASLDGSKFTQLATTIVGVIGSIVGAYFGVKIGTDGTQKALESQRQEAARSQIFAAHLPPAQAEHALELAFRPGGPSAPKPAPDDPATPAPAGKPAPPDEPDPSTPTEPLPG